jgi:Fe-S-cluster formation regulator IscX/YfhJ
LVKRVIGEMDADDGWVALGQMGTQLANLQPDFDPRTFGFKKLSDLVRSLDGLELRREGGQVRVRILPETPKPPAPRARKR